MGASSSSTEPGQVYPRAHRDVVTDDFIDLRQFENGEVAGTSDFSISGINEGSTTASTGEFDYQKVYNLLGI